MKKLLSFWVSRLIGLLLVGAVAVGAVEFKDLNIAIIWNDHTSSYQAPYGWQVGTTTSGEATEAPEIGKAQLKRLLNAIDPTITIDANNSSLDGSDIPDELTNGDGIQSGPFQGKLTNIRIYKNGSALTLDKIKSDFDGEIISSILYVNGGYITNNENIYQLLRDAADNEIGIMAVGSEAATEAIHIDTSSKVFPVMGVQNYFRFKASEDEDIITEFNLLDGNDIDQGSFKKEIPDTVDLFYSYGANAGEPDTLKMVYVGQSDNGNIKTNGLIFRATVKSGVITVDSNATILNNDDVIGNYGEFSIRAKAVAVIPNDKYAPDMNYGNSYINDLILVARNNDVFVAKASWGSRLMANDSIIADRGAVCPGLKALGTFDGEDFVLGDSPYLVTAKNIDDPSIIDTIKVLKPGTRIEGVATDQANNLDLDATYIRYNAGGLADLKLQFRNTDSTIFSKVFPTLLGDVSDLKFKPYAIKGRINADADIWAFNEQLSLGSFNEIYEGGAFDPTKYYVSYLGDQVAGKTGLKQKQFIKIPEAMADFDKPFDTNTVDFLGYDKNDKLYHLISAVQNNHRRLVMLGFQPSYLVDTERTKDLLADAIKWISVDDFKLPDLIVQPEDGSNIFTTLDSLEFTVDFSLKGLQIKSASYKFHLELEYDGQTYTYDSIVPADQGTESVDKFLVKFDQLKPSGLTIDPTKLSAETLLFDASATPTDSPAFFEGSEVSGTFNIYKLQTPTFKEGDENGTEEYESSSFADAIACSTTTSATGDSVISGVNINWSIDGTDQTGGASVFDITINPSDTNIVTFASLTGFINSENVTKEYIQTAQEFGLKNGKYHELDSIADGLPDLITVELKDLAKQIIGDNPGITAKDVLDSVIAYVDLPDGITLDPTKTHMTADSLLYIYVEADPNLFPKTTVNNADILKTTKNVLINGIGKLDQQEVKIQDGMGPVIEKAIFDPVTNILTVIFSENVVIPTIVDEDSLFKFTDESGNVFIVSGLDASGLTGDSITFTVGSVVKGGVESVLKNGDFIQLKGTSGVLDDKGNLQDKDSKKIAIEVSSYPFDLTTATFLDTSSTADGKIDLIDVKFDDYTLAIINDPTIGVTVDEVATALEGDIALKLASKKLTVKGVVANEDGDGFYVIVADSSNPINTKDENDSLIITEDNVIDSKAILNKDTLDIIDGVAPVLIQVIVKPNDGTDSTSIGTIDLIFSEEVEVPNDIEEYLEFKDKDGNTYKLDLEYDQPGTKSDTHTYIIKSGKSTIGGTIVFPLDKDSVTLTDGSGITDGTNVQDKGGDPLVITVGDYPEKTTIDVIGPFDVNTDIPDGLFDLVGVDKNQLIDVSTNTSGNVNGTALIITISNNEITDPSELWAELTIFDVVGNIVGKANVDDPKPAPLTVSVSKMPNSPKYAVTGVWSGKNEIGRTVGTGNYLVIVDVKRYVNGRLVNVIGFPRTETLLVKKAEDE